MKGIKVSQNRSSSMSQSKSVSHRKAQKSSDNKIPKFQNVKITRQEIGDVEMEEEEQKEIDTKLFEHIHTQPNDDMDIDDDNTLKGKLVAFQTLNSTI